MGRGRWTGLDLRGGEEILIKTSDNSITTNHKTKIQCKLQAKDMTSPQKEKDKELKPYMRLLTVFTVNSYKNYNVVPAVFVCHIGKSRRLRTH